MELLNRPAALTMPAHTGVETLVPSMTSQPERFVSSIHTPVNGSATDETSGVPRELPTMFLTRTDKRGGARRGWGRCRCLQWVPNSTQPHLGNRPGCLAMAGDCAGGWAAAGDDVGRSGGHRGVARQIDDPFLGQEVVEG